MFQSFEWFQRHQAGWKQPWWQSEVLAWIGLPFFDLSGFVAFLPLALLRVSASVPLRIAFLLIAVFLVLVIVHKVVYELALSLLKD
jgi:hypothetical protein